MRYILFVFLYVICLHAQAGDTLTRAQVYNFNVGDTFDYRNSSVSTDNWWAPMPIYTTSISYSRNVVTNIYWSADTLTKYIARKQTYPSPVSFDTLALSNINGYEVILDLRSACTDSFITSGLPKYFGKATNTGMQLL